MTADLRLRLQELVRHNRQGELPRPGFWPEAAAGLFWPLVLGLSLCLIIAAIAGLRPARPASLAAGSPLNPAMSSPVSERERTQPPEAAESQRQPAVDAPPPAPAGPDAAPAPATAETVPPPLELDPLLALLAEEEHENLLLAASPDPASGTLRLTLSSAVRELDEGELRQRAERWQQRALANGYERLELVDSQGRQLGRQALVGSGMILLAPASAS